MTANKTLRFLFLDYFNNYLSIDKFAEHNEITTEEAEQILKIGKRLHENFVSKL